MAIGGKQRENTNNIEFVLKTGVFEGTVVAVNPSKEELCELWETDKIEKEIEYTKETKDGDDAVSLSFFLKDTEGGLHNVRFFLVDKERENKDKTKKQYINLSGATSWADSKNNLQDWFTAKENRIAKVGEEELYGFLRSWLNLLDWNTNEEFLDTKKLFKGNVKELRDLMKSEFASTVLANAIITEVEKDGEKKLYQQVYNRAFLPGNCMKFFTTKGKKQPKMVQKFIDSFGGEYGCKDIYSLEPLADFDGEIKSSSAPKKKVADDDDSY